MGSGQGCRNAFVRLCVDGLGSCCGSSGRLWHLFSSCLSSSLSSTTRCFPKRKALLVASECHTRLLSAGCPLPLTALPCLLLLQPHQPPTPRRDMVDGMRMDLVKSRYDNYDELYEYCYR